MAQILIVDDDSEIRMMLERILASYSDHTPLTAKDGPEALELAPQADLILMDIQMPGMDGIQVFQALRQHETTRDIPVIFMTAYPEKSRKVALSHKLGSIDYLVKPVDCDQLINHIELLLGIRAAQNRFQKTNLSQSDQFTLLLAALEQSSDGITVTDRKGSWLLINHSMAEMFGYRIEEFMNLPPDALYAPESGRKLAEEIIPTLEQKNSWDGELVGQKKSGELFSVLVSLAVVKDNLGKFLGIMGITKDVSTLKQAFADLEQAQKTLIRSERIKALGGMAAGIAHDFNNFLSRILGHTQLLLAKVDKPEEIKRLRIIEKASLNIAKTVKRLQILAVEEVHSHSRTVDLKKILEKAVEMIRPRLNDLADRTELNAEIKTDLGEIPPIRGNEKELTSAFFNILSNSVEALSEGGEITVWTELTPDSVRILISDTGIGMDPEIMEKAFEPYFTTGRPLKSGLGLSVAFGTIQKYGGKLALKSSPGRGTVATVTLPRIEAEPANPVESGGEEGENNDTS